MKHLVLIICGCLCALSGFCQASQQGQVALDSTVTVNKKPKKLTKEDIASMPQFPGGQKAMAEYMEEHLVYPKAAEKYAAKCKVIVSFVVEKDGTVSNVQTMDCTMGSVPSAKMKELSADEQKLINKELSRLFEKSAHEAVQQMPQWTPAKDLQGNAVRVKYRIPISFKR